jgi:NADPH-dependent glutamate synthase beta subunit-like oxidoreductase
MMQCFGQLDVGQAEIYPFQIAMPQIVFQQLQYLEASRQKRLHVTAKKVVCIGGGDTSIDVVCSSRRLGTLKDDLQKILDLKIY